MKIYILIIVCSSQICASQSWESLLQKTVPTVAKGIVHAGIIGGWGFAGYGFFKLSTMPKKVILDATCGIEVKDSDGKKLITKESFSTYYANLKKNVDDVDNHLTVSKRFTLMKKAHDQKNSIITKHRVRFGALSAASFLTMAALGYSFFKKYVQ